jgi:hypothetical protein
MRGRFLEAILQRTERKLAGPGRPGTVDELVAKVERREVPRPTSLGARGALPREVGSPPASKGASQASWRLPPLHPLARFARDWQTSDALRRENAKVWLFEICIADLVSRARCSALRAASQNRDRTKHRRFVRPRLCSAPLRKSYALRCVRGTIAATSPRMRESIRPRRERHRTWNPP